MKFCRDVPAKEGKRLQCLFYILRDEETSSGNNNPSHQKDIGSHAGMDTLQKECADILRKRSKMFQYVLVKCLHICVSIYEYFDIFHTEQNRLLITFFAG